MRIWDGLRKKKLARKMDVGVGDNGMTSYERDAAHAARSNVSARGAVGSEGCKDGRGRIRRKNVRLASAWRDVVISL